MSKVKHGAGNWRAKLVAVIQSHKVQVFFVVLLVLDVVVIFIELFIDAEFPACRIIVRDAFSCCEGGGALDAASSSSHTSSSAAHASSDAAHRMLASASGSSPSGGFCPHPLVDAGATAACDAHAHDEAHTAHEVLFWTSVAILAAFAIELLALLCALGRHFFRNPLYVLDGFIVASSLALEIGLRIFSNGAAGLAGALILARIWRFMRIAHGLVVSTHELHEHDEHAGHAHEKSACELEEELERILLHAAALEAEIVETRKGCGEE